VNETAEACKIVPLPPDQIIEWRFNALDKCFHLGEMLAKCLAMRFSTHLRIFSSKHFVPQKKLLSKIGKIAIA
jgi:hypothetical protein